MNQFPRKPVPNLRANSHRFLRPLQPPTVPTPAASEAPRQTQIVSYGFHTDKWAELYSKCIDEMIAVLKTKGVPVLSVRMRADA